MAAVARSVWEAPTFEEHPSGTQSMRITEVEAIVVERPDLDVTAADAMQDALIVRVTTDEGVVGYGEGNHTPRAMKAIIESPGSHSWSQGLKDLLLGQDPLTPERVWDRLYRGTAMSGRRGNGDRRPGGDRCGSLGYQGKG